MNNSNIAFWTPINSKSGFGHFYRLLGLYEKLHERGNSVFYFTNEEYIQVEKNVIIKSNISSNLEQIINYLKSLSVKVLIIDNYKVSSKDLEVLDNNFRIVYFDSNFENPHIDIIINFNQFSIEKYNQKYEKTKYFLGLKYLIFREEIKKTKKVEISPNSIFICIGGSDVSNTTYKLIEHLPLDNFFYKIVLGKGCSLSYINDVERKLKDKGIKYLLYYHPKNFFTILNSCEYAIVSCSTIVYELFYFDKPFFCINVISNQDKLEKYLKEQSITVLRKDNLKKVTELINNRYFNKLLYKFKLKNIELIEEIEVLNEKF